MLSLSGCVTLGKGPAPSHVGFLICKTRGTPLGAVDAGAAITAPAQTLLPPFLPLGPSCSQDLSQRQERRGLVELGERAGGSQGALFSLPLPGY